jgi:excisionase family DNA binding protein
MSASDTPAGEEARHWEVLTLAEAAGYLRVPEHALIELVAEQAVPAQKIAGEWRFLKRALDDWLRYGPQFHREMKLLPFWVLESILPDLVLLLEKRLSARGASEQPAPPRGSKEAVLKHFGKFRGDPEVEGMLADIYARRKTEGGGGEG